MSLATVRAGIGTVLSGVAGISGGAAKVHDYFRNITDEAVLKSLTVGSSARLHVWMITLAEGSPFITENPAGQPGRGIAQEFGRYAFELWGWYAVKDGDQSEKAWANQVEAVVDAFRVTKKLGVVTVIDAGPAQWVEGGYRNLSNVLCHFARVQLRVKERREP